MSRFVFSKRTTLAMLAVCGMAAAGGCGGDTGPLVAGTVTRDGVPLSNGSISFTPDSAGGNPGPSLTLRVIEGRFSTADETGLPPTTPGANTVRVYALPAARPGRGGDDQMPVEYRFQTEIPAAGTTDLMFDVAEALPPTGRPEN